MATPPRSQADVFVLLLKNVWLLGFYLVIVLVFGIMFWAIFGWLGVAGVTICCLVLSRAAGRAGRAGQT